MYHTIIPHCIATFHTIRDIAWRSITPYRTYSTLHLILHHSHIRMNNAHLIWHCKIFHITPDSIPRHVMCDLVVLCGITWYGVLCWKCGSMWNIGSRVVVVRCGMYNIPIASRTSPHYHHILHCIIPHQTPSLTLFQTTPQRSTSHHHSSQSHISYHTVPPTAHRYSTLQYQIWNHTISATLCITLTFRILHPISHY